MKDSNLYEMEPAARAYVQTLEAEVETAHNDYVDAMDEAERLRAENSDLGSHFSWVQDSEIPVCPYEAEVERLDEELLEKDGEIERLRAEKETGYWNAKNLQAEIERLRTQLKDMTRDRDNLLKREGDALDEVERLREELTQGLGPLSEGLVPMTPVEAYRAGTATMEAEVERLQEHAERLGTDLLASRAENERLRKENKEAVREVRRLVQGKVDLQGEVERLQDKVRNLEATLVAQIKDVVNGTED